MARVGTLVPLATPWVELGYSRNISSDGRFIVFTSKSANLVPGQVDQGSEIDPTLDNAYDVFLTDRVANTTTLVSHSVAGLAFSCNSGSIHPILSADGRYIAYESNATDLVAGFVDTNGPSYSDVYLFDRMSGTNVLVSRSAAGPAIGGSGWHSGPIVSNTGIVTFTSNSDNLVTSYLGAPDIYHVYVYDPSTGANQFVDHKFGSTTAPAYGAGLATDLSTDGRFVIFTSVAKDLLSVEQAQYIYGVYMLDRLTNAVTLVSHTYDSATTVGDINGAGWGIISADGKYIAYISGFTNIVSGYSGPAMQIYLYDVSTGINVLVTHAKGQPTVGGNLASTYRNMCFSSDGRYLTYESSATNLVSGFVDSNGIHTKDIYVHDRNSGDNHLVSRAAGSTNIGGAGTSDRASISGDGRYVAFTSDANNLIDGFIDGNSADATKADVFLFDQVSSTTTLVSYSLAGPLFGGNGGSFAPRVSADGKSIAYTSNATNVVAGVYDANGQLDVFVFDTGTDSNALASRRYGMASATAGGLSQANQLGIQFGVMSDDGRWFAYASTAANLSSGQVEGNTTRDVFMRDRLSGITTLVSHAVGSMTLSANGESSQPIISGDGRFVVFRSAATNLVDGFVDANGPLNLDLYQFDRVTGMVTLISHDASSPANGSNADSGTKNSLGAPLTQCMSHDGRFVTFASLATNLVAGFVANAGGPYIYLFDRTTGENILVSHSVTSPAHSPNNYSYQTTISADGNFVAFTSNASDMVPGQTIGARAVFLFNRLTGAIVLVSHPGIGTGVVPYGSSDSPRISADGRIIAYQVGAGVGVYDRLIDGSVAANHIPGSSNASNNFSDGPQMSSDGRYVVFQSSSTDLVAGFVDNNGTEKDVYLFDRLTGEVTLVSRSSSSTVGSGNRDSFRPQVSDDGRFVLYGSYASNLVPGFVDNNLSNYADMYIFDRVTGKNTLVSHTTTTVDSGNSQSANGFISRDGSLIYFNSQASNLVPNDFNSDSDVFWYSNSPSVAAMQVGDGAVQRSMIRSVTLTFDQQVTFAADPAAAFTLTRTTPTGPQGNVALSASVSTVGGTTTVTLTFTGLMTQFGSLIDGAYKLTASASQISAAGPLDGDNNGFAGDDYVLTFHRLFGDADGNRTVDLADFELFRMSLGGYDPAFDFNNDGTVSNSDFNQFRVRFGSDI